MKDDFIAFPWTMEPRSPIEEKAQSANIMKHLRAHAAGCVLDTLEYELVDTHSNKFALISRALRSEKLLVVLTQ